MFARKKLSVKKQATPLGGAEIKKLRKQLTQVLRARCENPCSGAAAAAASKGADGDDALLATFTSSLVDYLLPLQGKAAAVTVTQLSVPVTTASNSSQDASGNNSQKGKQQKGKQQQQQGDTCGSVAQDALVTVYSVRNVAILLELDKWTIKHAVLSAAFADTLVDQFGALEDTCAKLQNAFATEWVSSSSSSSSATARVRFDSFNPPDSPWGNFLLPTCFFFILVNDWALQQHQQQQTRQHFFDCCSYYRTVEMNGNTTSYVMQGANLMLPGVRGVSSFPNTALLKTATLQSDNNNNKATTDEKEKEEEEEVLKEYFVQSITMLRQGIVPILPTAAITAPESLPPPRLGEVVAMGGQYNAVPFAVGVYCCAHGNNNNAKGFSKDAAAMSPPHPPIVRYANATGVCVRLIHSFGDALCLHFLPEFLASRRASTSTTTTAASIGGVPRGYDAALGVCLSTLSSANAAPNSYFKPQFVAYTDKKSGKEHGSVGIDADENVWAGLKRLVAEATEEIDVSSSEEERDEDEEAVEEDVKNPDAQKQNGTEEDEQDASATKRDKGQEQQRAASKHMDPTSSSTSSLAQQEEQEEHEKEGRIGEAEAEAPQKKITMDEAAVFALMEAVGSIVTTELPIPVNQFYPQRLLKALPHSSWILPPAAATAAPSAPHKQKQKPKQKGKGGKCVDDEDEGEDSNSATAKTTTAADFDIKHTTFKKTIKLFQVFAQAEWDGLLKLKETAPGQFTLDAVNKNSRVYREHRGCYYSNGVPNLKLRCLYSRYAAPPSSSSATNAAKAKATTTTEGDDDNDDARSSDDDDDDDEDMAAGVDAAVGGPSHRILSITQEYWMDQNTPGDPILRALLLGKYKPQQGQQDDDEEYEEEEEEEGAAAAVAVAVGITPKHVKDAVDLYVSKNNLRHQVRVDVLLRCEREFAGTAAAVSSSSSSSLEAQKKLPKEGFAAVWDPRLLQAAAAPPSAQNSNNGQKTDKKTSSSTQMISVIEVTDEMRVWLPNTARYSLAKSTTGKLVRWISSAVAAPLVCENVLRNHLWTKCVLRFVPLTLSLDKQIGLHTDSSMQGYDAAEATRSHVVSVEHELTPAPIRIGFALKKQHKKGSKKRRGTTMVIASAGGSRVARRRASLLDNLKRPADASVQDPQVLQLELQRRHRHGVLRLHLREHAAVGHHLRLQVVALVGQLRELHLDALPRVLEVQERLALEVFFFFDVAAQLLQLAEDVVVVCLVGDRLVVVADVLALGAGALRSGALDGVHHVEPLGYAVRQVVGALGQVARVLGDDLAAADNLLLLLLALPLQLADLLDDLELRDAALLARLFLEFLL